PMAAVLSLCDSSPSAAHVDVVTSASTVRASREGERGLSAEAIVAQGSTTTTTAVAATGDVLETEEARGLLELGREAGSLTADEIALALDELELDVGQLDDFYHALDELHIEIVQDRAEEDEL